MEKKAGIKKDYVTLKDIKDQI